MLRLIFQWLKRPRSQRRVKHALQGVTGLCLALAGVSYTRALLAPNSPGWDLRSAEWVRDNHGGWALDLAEWCWLSVHRPSAEELHTQLSEFPMPFSRQRQDLHPSPVEPAPIAPLFDKPVPGEGVWRAVGSTVNGVPALRCTLFRPDPQRPEVSVAVARFNPELTRFVLVPGTRDPGGDWSWHGGIPEDQRESLLSAFNSGFRLKDSRGGLYAEGKVAWPLVVGAASLVIDQNGAADIVAWTADRKLTELASVRQNIEMIVIGGEVRADLASGGATSNGGCRRSGLGITADGALIYAAGSYLHLYDLARALKHAGAVRAMQLDIHTQWPAFNVFQPTSRRGPKLSATKLITSMRHPAKRYLKPDDRDFVAVFIR